MERRVKPSSDSISQQFPSRIQKIPSSGSKPESSNIPPTPRQADPAIRQEYAMILDIDSPGFKAGKRWLQLATEVGA